MIHNQLRLFLACGVIGLVSCNVSPTNSGAKADGEDSTADQAVASSGSEGFSLSLPELPGTPTANAVARLQIFKGLIQQPPIPGCIGRPDEPVPLPGDVITSPGGPSEVVGNELKPSMPIPTPSPLPVVSDLKMPYVAGNKIGPIKLPNGVYTALFTVVGGQPSAQPSLLRFAVSPFKVSMDDISEVRLKMRRQKDCYGSGTGEVIFRPVEDGKHPPKP